MAVPSNWKPPSTPKELWFKGHRIIFQFVGHKLGHNIEMIIVSTLFVIISKAHNFFILMHRITWVDLLKEGMKRNALLKFKCHVSDISLYKDRDDFLVKKSAEIC